MQIPLATTSLHEPEIFANTWLTNATNLAQAALSLNSLKCVSGVAQIYTEGFDNTGVWAQLEMISSQCITLVSEMGVEANKNVVNAFGIDEEAFLDLSESEELPEADENIDVADDELVDLEAASDSEENYDEGNEPAKKKNKRSLIDDDFFSLEEFNKFTDDAENHDLKNAMRNGENPSDEDDEFNFDLEEYDEDESCASENENANDIRFADFFESPSNSNAESKPRRKNWKDEMEIEQVTEEEELNESDHEEELDLSKLQDEDIELDPEDLLAIQAEAKEAEASEEKLSTFEKHQRKMQKKIAILEGENIAKKAWTMSGESSAKARPLNSLLEQSLEVEHVSKPAPVYDEETAKTLEDLIIQRIKDSAFDDVVRKVVTVLKVRERTELDDSKPKKSLAMVYEDEFIRQTTKTEVPTEKSAALSKSHSEIEILAANLFNSLASLSNFNYTPPVVEEDIIVIANTPAILMEEVTPSSMATSAQMLSAAEVYKAKIGKSRVEMNKNDLNKVRRAGKVDKARKRKLEDLKRKAESNDRESSGQVNPDSIGGNADAVKHLMKQKNVTMITKGGSKDARHLKKGARIIGREDALAKDAKKNVGVMMKL